MSIKNTGFILLLFISLSNYSFSNERRYKVEDSLRNSTNVVIVLKVGGRVNCNTSNWNPDINYSDTCFGAHLTKEMEHYNLNKKTEDFLVLKSLKGQKQQGDIIKVNFKDEMRNESNLSIGAVYLMFFHYENEEFYYEYCDVLAYEKIEKMLKKNLSLEKLVELLLRKNLADCFSFSAGVARHFTIV